MRRLGWVGTVLLGATIWLSACANDTLGTECEGKSDCDSGEECVPLAICVDAEDCQRSCEKPCASDMDCGEGGTCALRAEAFICQ